MTDEELEAAGYFNGAVWEAERPLCWRVVLSYMPGDKWALMSTPEKSIQRGRYVMNAYVDERGKWLHDFAELPERLQRYRWLKDCTLAPISETLDDEHDEHDELPDSPPPGPIRDALMAEVARRVDRDAAIIGHDCAIDRGFAFCEICRRSPFSENR